AAHPAPERPRIVLHPRAVDDTGFTVGAVPDGFVVRGEKPERWVQQTDFSNDEAVGYLADRLARLGVEDERVDAPHRTRAQERLAAKKARRSGADDPDDVDDPDDA